MAAKLWAVATSNAFNTTANGSIGSADVSINLNSTVGLQSPGVIVIDRTDGNGNATPTLREYITYTTLSGNTLSGVTRGVAGSTAQAHVSGAQIEEVMSITHWNDMVSFINVEHDTAGHHVIGTATINYTQTFQLVTTSLASIVQLQIGNNLSVSGASIQGFPVRPAWFIPGTLSGATTSAGSPVVLTDPGAIKWVSVILQQPASQASLQFDLKKNFSSVLGSSNILTVPINGTYISTASVATPSFIAGDVFSVDVSNPSSFGGNAVLQFYGR